jgi:hypothetical protein
VTDPLLVETVVLDGMWRVPDERADRGRRYPIAWFDPSFRRRSTRRPRRSGSASPAIAGSCSSPGTAKTGAFPAAPPSPAKPSSRRWGAETTAGLILERGLEIETGDREPRA